MYAVPIVFIILIITTNSWIEPFIFLISVGFQLLLTWEQISFPSISLLQFNSKSTSTCYFNGLFYLLVTCLSKEKAKTEDKNEAMAVAMKSRFLQLVPQCLQLCQALLRLCLCATRLALT